MKILNFLLASLLLTLNAFAEPPQKALVLNLGVEPTTLHPITSTDVYAQHVHAYLLDTLLFRDPDSYEWKPRLAEKWDISKDNKVFTFTLRKNAFFHDGKPVTAEDVKFSFDVIFDPAYNAAHKRPYFEGISKVEIVDPNTVRFYAKDTYFGNFNTAATLEVIPKHIYGDVEKSKKMSKEVVSCGPYFIEKYDKGQRLVMKKFDKWYGNDVPDLKGYYNLDRVTMRFVREDNVALEMLKKGDLDYMGLTPEQYAKKTDGPPWGTKVLKFKVENSSPKQYGFIGWNFRKDLFKAKNVRLALAHLMNRDEMNKKFRFGLSIPTAGPLYQQSEYADPAIKPIEFDKTLAADLLTKEGWSDSDKNGILDKTVDGKKVEFKFIFIYSNKESEKYWTLYREDLKKAGIEMEIKYLEWNSFIKLIDEGTFDAAALAWSGGDIDWDPKQIWHSSSAVKGGSNFIGYKNPEVDKLIDTARMEGDKAKRIPLLRQVYAKIAEDAPYAFLFNEKYSFYAHTSKVLKPKDTFKYEIGVDHWSVKLQ